MGASRAAAAMIAAFAAGLLASPAAAGQLPGPAGAALAVAALAAGGILAAGGRARGGRRLTTLGHELRTPLHSIGLHADALAAAGDRATAEHALATIRRNVAHALAVLEATLEAPPGRGARGAPQPPCAPGALALECAAMVRPQAARKGLAVEVAGAEALASTVASDPLRLRQILLILLQNAIESTERGGVRLELAAEGARLRIAVRDTGCGIGPGDLERIFRPGARARGAAVDPRRGFGLAIARDLARALGGDVAAASILGQGSTFTVTLPLSAAAPAAAPGHEAEPPLAGRILLAEDAADVRALLAAALRRAGAHVDAVAAGDEALERAIAGARARAAYDLLLLDEQLPGLSGAEVAARLRAAGSRTPVVALTAEPAAAGRLEAAGCAQVLIKPVGLPALLATAARHLAAGAPAAARAGTPGPSGALVAQFVDLLDERLRDLESAVAAHDVAAVCRLAHRLRGAAGSYGFAPVSDAAAALEDAARAGRALAEPLAELARRCARARGASAALPALAQSANSAR